MAQTLSGQRFNINVPHRFQEHNYKRFTFCDHCGSMLYGIMSQGLRCQGQHINIVLSCVLQVTVITELLKRLLVILLPSSFLVRSSGRMEHRTSAPSTDDEHWHFWTTSQKTSVSARIPLSPVSTTRVDGLSERPELTGDQLPLPVNTGRQD